MKKISQIIFYLLLLFSITCCNDSSTRNRGKEKGPTPSHDIQRENNMTVSDDTIAVNLNLSSIINRLNKEYPVDFNPRIKFINQQRDTIFVKVVDSELLTQRMGTSGAERYLKVVTYALSQNPEINYVNFDFMEGDHAVPGLYSQEDFEK